MKHSTLAVLVLAGAALVVGPVAAKPESLAGPWTLTVEHIGMKLSLEQQKSTITGTLDWPHGDPIRLTGMFADDTLVFSGNSAGENFTIHIDATGTRKADDTLAGTVRAHFDEFNDAHDVVRTRNQDIPWTAVRGLHEVVQFGR
jgi:hypothetical protein